MSGYWDTDRDDKEALLETSWRAGHKAMEIVRALQERFGGNPTKNTVVSKVHRLGLPMHQSNNAWRDIEAPARKPRSRAG